MPGLQAIPPTCLLPIYLAPLCPAFPPALRHFPLFTLSVFPFHPPPSHSSAKFLPLYGSSMLFPPFLTSPSLSTSIHVLTPWSASLLARERFGVTRPRLEPTGLGSWLRSAAPEGVMSLSAITSPTSLGLLQGKRGSGSRLDPQASVGYIHCVLLPPSPDAQLCTVTSDHPARRRSRKSYVTHVCLFVSG